MSRTGTAAVKSGFPTMMATGLPPKASRNTTKRVGVPSERHRSLACHEQRADGVVGEADHGVCFNPDDALFARDSVARHVRRQPCRQALRYLDELNGGRRRRARRFGRRHAIGACVGNQGRIEFASSPRQR